MDADWVAAVEQAAHEFLVWVGFGTLVGLAAKAVMPGRDPGGTVATLMMGISGSLIGCSLLAFLWEGHRITPISPVGFVVGTVGAFLLLAFYRLMSGRFFVETGTTANADRQPPSKRRRRSAPVEPV
jgi:uncharacterized membrane protein YeaQ/YmgE (transglycosylase-associated protein family)